jgi:hypothetical protein
MPLPVLYPSKKLAYWQKVRQTAAANLIGYWPMWEPSGSTSFDLSPEGNDGAYTGVTLGQPGIGDGRTSPLFDGANDQNDVISAGLTTDFDSGGDEVTIATWAKVKEAGTWEDSTFRRMFYLDADGDNNISAYRTSTNNQIAFRYEAATTVEIINIGSLSFTDWFHVALTVSLSAGANGEVKAYINGSQVGSTQTSLGTWSGALADAFIGILAASSQPWSGYLAHPFLSTTPYTAAQIASLAVV